MTTDGDVLAVAGMDVTRRAVAGIDPPIPMGERIEVMVAVLIVMIAGNGRKVQKTRGNLAWTTTLKKR